MNQSEISPKDTHSCKHTKMHIVMYSHFIECLYRNICGWRPVDSVHSNYFINAIRIIYVLSFRFVSLNFIIRFMLLKFGCDGYKKKRKKILDYFSISLFNKQCSNMLMLLAFIAPTTCMMYLKFKTKRIKHQRDSINVHGWVLVFDLVCLWCRHFKWVFEWKALFTIA